MTESVEQQEPRRDVQCTLCHFLNVGVTPDAFCRNCGLSLERLFRDGKSVMPSALLAPVAVMTPADVPVTRPKKKRARKRKASALGASQPNEWEGHDAVSSQLSIITEPATPVIDATPLLTWPGTPISDIDSIPEANDADMSRVAPSPAPVSQEWDEQHEATVVATRRQPWALELEGGIVVPLPSDDIVIGRAPDPMGVATALMLPDPERTLSRTHARLRRDAPSDTWTIEDLDSTNGVATVSAGSQETELTPGQPGHVTEYLRLGTLKARLIKHRH